MLAAARITTTLLKLPIGFAIALSALASAGSNGAG